ncbi:hypothetical protein ACFL6Y_00875 [Elusimicrobiota bacterium]
MIKKEQQYLFRQEELVFFGNVTASMSHELNNVLAVIEQTAGLLEDIAMESNSDQPIKKDEVEKVLKKVSDQTKRGAAIIKRLNAFAHSVDESSREIDVGKIINAVASLAERMADRKRVSLEPRQNREHVTIRNNPFRVQQALYLSIKEAVSAAPEASKVMFSAGKNDSGTRITIESVCDAGGQAPKLSFVEMLMVKINGELKSARKGSRFIIELVFPALDDQLQL